MKTYRIAYTTTCPVCGRVDNVNVRGMAESHVDWIQRWAKTGIYYGLQCRGCLRTVDAQMTNVHTEQESRA